MKKILILGLFISTAAFGQNKQETFFLKDNGEQVKKKEKADFIRIVEEPDSGSVLYSVNEYYPDNSKKRTGLASKIDPSLVFEGEVTSYYRNGKKKEVTNYQNGRRVGNASFYYQNGQLREVVEIIPGTGKPGSTNDYTRERQRLISFFDSTGAQLVKDGTGAIKRFNDKNEVTEEGSYIEGEKDGIWKGRVGRSTYEETYEKGKFVQGVSKDEQGITNQYKELEKMPDYPGGIKEFYYYVGNNFSYPAEARKKGVSGRLIMGFVVEKDGRLSNIKIIRDLGAGTGSEAIRMLRSSPKWLPGQQHGIPVRVQYTLPIMLNLEPSGR
ncbi:antitoxin component YwqK of YwqJK toxin-antitoxin module [Arcticibacter tournemirensis]|nr:energy transducer TonB [Arcticibacter tournemirensis]TQM48350.1 antitoxin component YwqK of YwqJK toxin-antitoxin module [Arcticibacter tournemirensis]